MTSRIIGNLARQEKALSLLAELQKEEFTHLRVLDPAQVAGLEFSIHELMRQIMRERLELRGSMRPSPQASASGKSGPFFRIRQGDGRFPGGLHRSHRAGLRPPGRPEYRLALGLYNQSRSSIVFIQNQLARKKPSIPPRAASPRPPWDRLF
jgi:hypothetical protein